MKERNMSIQMLRGVLCLIIFAFHCDIPYADFGWWGVETFFVISSFFLVKKYWGNEMIHVKEQFFHRIIRLYPPYIPVVLAAALYAFLREAVPFDFAAHLFSLQNILWMATGYSSPMQPMTAHTWTLVIEVWIGLLWLFLLKALNKEQFKRSMYTALFFSIAYRTITIGIGCNARIVSLFPLAHMDAFACGSILAISVYEKRIDKRKLGMAALAGLTGIIICILKMAEVNNVSFIQGYELLSSSKNYLNHWFTGNIYLFLSLASSALIGVLYLHDTKTDVIKNRFVKMLIYIGNDSYALYLFHWPILVVAKRVISIKLMLLLIVFAISWLTVWGFNRGMSLIQNKLSKVEVK